LEHAKAFQLVATVKFKTKDLTRDLPCLLVKQQNNARGLDPELGLQ